MEREQGGLRRDHRAQQVLKDFSAAWQHMGPLPALDTRARWETTVRHLNEADLGAIAAEVGRWPVLTRRLLEIARFSLGRSNGEARVETIEHAMMVIGLNRVARAAVAYQLAGGLRSVPPSDVHVRRILAEGLHAEALADRIGRQFSDPRHEEVLIRIVLGTLGKVLCAHYLPEVWAAMEHRMARHRVSPGAAFKTEVGMTECELVLRTATIWGLPERMQELLRRAEELPDPGPELALADESIQASPAARLLRLQRLGREGARFAARVSWEISRNGSAETVHALSQAFAARLQVEPSVPLEHIYALRYDAPFQSLLVPLLGGVVSGFGHWYKPADLASRLANVADVGLDRLRAIEGFGALIEAVSREIHSACNARHGLLFVRRPGGVMFESRMRLGPDAAMKDASGPSHSPVVLGFPASAGSDPFTLACQQGRLLPGSGAAALEPALVANHFSPLGAFVLIPVVVQGVTLGALYFDWTGETGFTTEEILALERLRRSLSALMQERFRPTVVTTTTPAADVEQQAEAVTAPVSS